MTLPERFMDKVIKQPDGCWQWTGSIRPDGYGAFGYQHKTMAAHRIAYEAIVGTIPAGLVMDHLCRNRSCVNPAHLEPVTDRINVLCGVGITAVNAQKTHCKRGHPFSGDNLRLKQRPTHLERCCRTCTREAQRTPSNDQ